ncbi:MAG: MlaD family protein [Bacteroidota bacterium]|nr:MlaD family protein [Bacteroidota bacterium]MDP4206071.1 MlaD family protein [Bacteroidota bacterium]
MKVSNLARTGILTVVTLIALYWGINFLKGKNVFSNVSEYQVIYNRVDGLVKSSSITLNGFKIGQVSDIKIVPDGSGRILVSFTITNDVKIPKHSIAKIVSTDLMGTKSISLILSREKEYYAPGDILPGTMEGDLKQQVSMQVLPLKYKAEQLMGSLDSAMTVVTYVFNERTRQNLRESFEHINSTILNIESSSKDIKELFANEKYTLAHIINNVDSISSTLSRNSRNITSISRNLSSFSDSLANLRMKETLGKTENTLSQLNSILAKINNQEGSIGLLVNNPNLYRNLERTSNSLDLLLRDIRVNPQRYIHFSAFDLGKKVSISTGAVTKNNIVFKILLVSSQNHLPMNSRLFENIEIEEVKVIDTYNYFTGATPSYNEAVKNRDNLSDRFPDAKIIAFKNGKKISIEKALKSISK